MPRAIETVIGIRLQDLASPALQQTLRNLGVAEKETLQLNRTIAATAPAAAGGFRAMASSVWSFATSMRGLVAGGAIAGLVYGLRNAMSQVEQFGMTVWRVQAIMGATSQEAAGFVDALDDIGMEATQIARAVYFMERNLGAAGNKLEQMLGTLGINIGTMKSAEERFWGIIKALGRMEDTQRRTSVAQQVFGRGALNLMQIMEMTTQELRELEQASQKSPLRNVFTAQMTQQVKDYHLALQQLHDTWLAFKAERLSPVMKFMTGIAQFLGGGGIPDLWRTEAEEHWRAVQALPPGWRRPAERRERLRPPTPAEEDALLRQRRTRALEAESGKRSAVIAEAGRKAREEEMRATEKMHDQHQRNLLVQRRGAEAERRKRKEFGAEDARLANERIAEYKKGIETQQEAVSRLLGMRATELEIAKLITEERRLLGRLTEDQISQEERAARNQLLYDLQRRQRQIEWMRLAKQGPREWAPTPGGIAPAGVGGMMMAGRKFAPEAPRELENIRKQIGEITNERLRGEKAAKEAHEAAIKRLAELPGGIQAARGLVRPLQDEAEIARWIQQETDDLREQEQIRGRMLARALGIEEEIYDLQQWLVTPEKMRPQLEEAQRIRDALKDMMDVPEDLQRKWADLQWGKFFVKQAEDAADKQRQIWDKSRQDFEEMWTRAFLDLQTEGFGAITSLGRAMLSAELAARFKRGMKRTLDELTAMKLGPRPPEEVNLLAGNTMVNAANIFAPAAATMLQAAGIFAGAPVTGGAPGRKPGVGAPSVGALATIPPSAAFSQAQLSAAAQANVRMLAYLTGFAPPARGKPDARARYSGQAAALTSQLATASMVVGLLSSFMGEEQAGAIQDVLGGAAGFAQLAPLLGTAAWPLAVIGGVLGLFGRKKKKQQAGRQMFNAPEQFEIQAYLYNLRRWWGGMPSASMVESRANQVIDWMNNPVVMPMGGNMATGMATMIRSEISIGRLIVQVQAPSGKEGRAAAKAVYRQLDYYMQLDASRVGAAGTW